MYVQRRKTAPQNLTYVTLSQPVSQFMQTHRTTPLQRLRLLQQQSQVWFSLLVEQLHQMQRPSRLTLRRQTPLSSQHYLPQVSVSSSRMSLALVAAQLMEAPQVRPVVKAPTHPEAVGLRSPQPGKKC